MSCRLRGNLPRVVCEKLHNDQILEECDAAIWYTLNYQLPPAYQEKFVPLLQPDNTTIRWLEEAKELSNKIWLHIWHALARAFLQFVMTQTDINGFLNRGSMYILSEQQFETILKASGFDADRFETLNFLDIGAGDGKITERISKSLQSGMQNKGKIHIYATETSWSMRNRLKKLNFNVINHIDELDNVQLIACLNVLDRCVDPFELLDDMYKALAPDGRCILALVLPYAHYVEFNSSHLPSKPLLPQTAQRKDTRRLCFEEEAMQFFKVLEGAGFQVESWTKAPYLCEGDLRQSFYWLIDLIVVVSKKPRA